MKVLSVNVGGPRDVPWNGRVVRTSIYKSPVAGPVAVATLNLAGDAQSDLSVHGGVHKAVYAYPSEHYPFWRRELPGMDLPWGVFGENLTTTDLLEDTLCIGDRLRIGTAEFVVTQPRLPCFKLGIRFGDPDMIKRFLRSGRTGFYFAVAKEGSVAAGDSIEWLTRDEHRVSVADIVHLYATGARDEELLRRATGVSALPESWREHFRKQLEAISIPDGERS